MNSVAPLRISWLLSIVVLVGGCAVGPNFTQPAAPDVDRYDQTQMTLPGAGDGQPQQTLQPGSVPAAQWWRAFASTPLNDTVDLALRGSPTLEAAHATLSAASETLAAPERTARPAIIPARYPARLTIRLAPPARPVSDRRQIPRRPPAQAGGC